MKYVKLDKKRIFRILNLAPKGNSSNKSLFRELIIARLNLVNLNERDIFSSLFFKENYPTWHFRFLNNESFK